MDATHVRLPAALITWPGGGDSVLAETKYVPHSNRTFRGRTDPAIRLGWTQLRKPIRQSADLESCETIVDPEEKLDHSVFMATIVVWKDTTRISTSTVYIYQVYFSLRVWEMHWKPCVRR